MSKKHPFVDPIPGFFTPVFGELLLGGNCETVEADPNADPFDKEICRTFRQFNERFMHFSQQDVYENEPHEELPHREHRKNGDDQDPESLKGAILKREDGPRSKRDYSKRATSRVDEDLDSELQDNPALLDEVLERSSGREEPSPRVEHYHSYSSVVVTQRPDGTIEQRVTKRDSEGNEEVTVTYSDGHKSHIRTPQSDPNSDSNTTDRDSVKRSGDGLFSRMKDWVWGGSK